MSSPTHSKSVASKASEKRRTSQVKHPALNKNQPCQLNTIDKKAIASHSTISDKKPKATDPKKPTPAASQGRPRRAHKDGDTNPDRSISDGQGHHLRGSNSLQLRSRIEYENTYKTGPDARFGSYEVTKLIQKVFDETLTEVTYDTNRCKDLSQALVGQILSAVKKMGVARYKFVAVVSLGSVDQQPGTHFTSRCLWDLSVDTFASASFNNESLYAVATVYALYQE